jgi:hypothetical protein
LSNSSNGAREGKGENEVGTGSSVTKYYHSSSFISVSLQEHKTSDLSVGQDSSKVLIPSLDE